MRVFKALMISASVLIWLPAQAAGTVDELLQEYRQQGAGDFSAKAGEAMWTKDFQPKGTDKPRRCSTCHTADLRQDGKHAQTGKRIRPLAPSISARRLTNKAKVRKWFKRNCKWTLGRECTPQEKGDFLSYMRSQ